MDDGTTALDWNDTLLEQLTYHWNERRGPASTD